MTELKKNKILRLAKKRGEYDYRMQEEILKIPESVQKKLKASELLNYILSILNSYGEGQTSVGVAPMSETCFYFKEMALFVDFRKATKLEEKRDAENNKGNWAKKEGDWIAEVTDYSKNIYKGRRESE